MKTRILLGVMAAVCAYGVGLPSFVAADDSARALNIQISRYEQMIDKLTRANEDLRGQVRELERTTQKLTEKVDASVTRTQSLSDEVQRLTNIVDLRKVWGDGKRDCTELGMKHQQIKLVMKGNVASRFLCFDGMSVLLGTETYDAAEK
jgi:predicted RNase H-like nuclease (RuvC/YqgF family)